MAASVLLDTGAILAILYKKDEWHRACKNVLHDVALPLMTSEAVLAELFHLIDPGPHDMEAAWSFLRSSAIVLAPIEHGELPAIHQLMSLYADRPMDFADATLVHLAQREGISTIFTTDHADFETYRIEGRKRFRILPANRP